MKCTAWPACRCPESCEGFAHYLEGMRQKLSQAYLVIREVQPHSNVEIGHRRP